MSLKSMTGFGSGSAAVGGMNVEVELGSVNRKQLDVRLSLPRNLSVLEPRIREMVQAKISRGNLNVSIKISASGEATGSHVTVDKNMSATYVRELRKVAKELNLEDDLKASVLLRLPDVIQYKSATDNTDKVWSLIKKALSQALSELVAMRKVEGSTLEIDMKSRFDKLAIHLTKLQKLAPSVSKEYKKRLRKRLKDAGIESDDLDSVVAKELIVFVDRADINEELVRLDSHFKQVAGLMRATKPTGRALDFLCQEMFREINTIGSKGNDTRVSKEVIAFKAELESIREQVQNIE